MRILINASYAPSLVNFRGRLLERLKADGHIVCCTAADLDPQTLAWLDAREIECFPVKLQRNGIGPLSDLEYFAQIRNATRIFRPDLVISYTAKPNIWGSLAARLSHARSASMVTGAGYAMVDPSGVKAGLVRKVTAALYRMATALNDKVVFQNPDDLNLFVRVGALKDRAKAVIVNGSGVPTDHFAPAPLPPEPKFLMIARLRKSKGICEYAEATKILRDRGHSWPVRLVGPHEEAGDAIDVQSLDRWAAEGLDYLGPLNDVRPQIADCSVYVLPSYHEGTPRSVLEAMAMSRPIITTNVPGCRETVIDGVNGLLVPAKDAIALADAMEQLGRDHDLRVRMSKASLEIVREKFDVDEVNDALLEALDIYP